MTHPVKIKRTCIRLLFFTLGLTVILAILPGRGIGQRQDSLSLISGDLKKLSLEELMDIEVTSVSRRPEKLTEAASAIQVITQKDIHQSGAKTLAEALRLATNLQVAQVNSSQWAISARGFDNVLANKLLVLIDGRTVYTPLYAGVFWDVQNVILEDIDRIEVISGPGGTLWGANAVNGVINIITKNSSETKGLYAEAAAGSSLPGLGSLRYGGQLAKKLSYRMYGTGFKMDHTLDTNFVSAKDQWTMFQGGFRLDWNPSEKDRFSLQANLYGGKPNPDGGDTTAIVARGDNITARWNHTHSAKSDWQLQAYYDHTWRDFKNGFTEDLKTYDLDWQNRNQLGKRHTLTYGMNLRLMNHTVTNLPLFRFEPAQKTLYLYSVYIQDEIILINDRLRITVGSKVEHNSYTGFEFQPNGRLTWTATQKQTIWTAVSRAVRTPARIDRDFSLYLTPDLALISGSDDFKSENVVAYELGWRLQPQNNFSISLATFYNVYNNLRSAEPGPPPFNIPISFANGVSGKTYGLEVSSSYQMNSQWSIRGGYTYLKKKLTIEPGSSDLNEGTAESDDPEHQFLIQSNLNVGKKFEVSPVFRYIDKLAKPHVAGYAGLDLRIGLTLNRHLELNLVGQNLLDNRHREFIASTPPREIERSIYGRIICRF